MFYDVYIRGKVKSNLSKEDLERQLVIALHDVETQYSKFDGVDDNLEVVDYDLTEAEEICPNCCIGLEPKVFDVDGIKLVECDVCDKCGYGQSGLL